MINIIAAVSENGIIGANGKIPWDIPEDKAYFKKITSGNIIIMGRRTFEEIGHPLPNRYNIIVSKKKIFYGENIITAGNFDEALNIAYIYGQKNNIKEIFLCGGEKIYKQGLKLAQRIYITEINREYDGDTFFPKFSTGEFHLSRRICARDSELLFCVYERCENL